MSLEAELTKVMELLKLPFMQRALMGGTLTGLVGGLMGSLTILRQLSFFSNALGHSALLGMSLGLLLGIHPSIVLLPFAIAFALGVGYLLQRTELWTDALLNIIYACSLALGLIILSFVERQTKIDHVLFGNILGIQQSDLILSSILLAGCLVFLGLTLPTQILIILHEPLAMARGVAVSVHRMLFMVLLSLVVVVAINTVGVLLVSAFVVIPASTARLISSRLTHYMMLSAGIGAFCAVLGVFFSALLNLPAGPTIVMTQFGVFLSAIALSRVKPLSC